MSDAEISRKLALVIGWQQVVTVDGTVSVPFDDYWRDFDYRDPTVIWPIAEAYNCFPEKYRANRYPGVDEILWSAKGVVSDTAAKAVALAVIKHQQGSKT